MKQLIEKYEKKIEALSNAIKQLEKELDNSLNHKKINEEITIRRTFIVCLKNVIKDIKCLEN